MDRDNQPPSRVASINRPFSGEQIGLIRFDEMMSSALTRELLGQENLVRELATDVHNTDLSYGMVVVKHFSNKDRGLSDIVESPFVKAFEATSMCKPENRELLSRIQGLVAKGDQPSNADLVELEEWLDGAIPLISRGFMHFVNHAGVIPPLTDDERRLKQIAGSATYKATHPDEVVQSMERARFIGRDIIHQPPTYTPGRKKEMQDLFDQGFSYAQVVALLQQRIGIETNATNLRSAVRNYDDLDYDTSKRIRAEERRSKAEKIRQEHGQKEKVNWTKTRDVDGRKIPLTQLMIEFLEQANQPRIRDEYAEFATYLKGQSIKINLTETAYRVKRKRILRVIKT